MTKILASSDWHGSLPRDVSEQSDILIIAGDVCPDYWYTHPRKYITAPDEQRQSRWLKEVFIPWAEQTIRWGGTKDIVFVAGNHDFVFEHEFLLPKSWPDHVHYLKDEYIEIQGVSMYGTPWVPNLPSWAFYATDNMLQARAEAIPAGIDILISHGPPLGYGDNVSWTHVGDGPLEQELYRIAPKAVVCGHIHEAFGIYPHTGSGAWIYSVSMKDRDYQTVNPFVEIKL